MANRTGDLVEAVQEAHKLDVNALLLYAQTHVPGFPLSPSKFNLSQFGHGQSNPTYLMEAEAGSGTVKRYVLRKKPPGKLLQSAHAVDREFQVLKALGDHTKVPVPKVFCLCNDPNVIGTAFYIMEFLEGRIFVDPNLRGVPPERRRAIYLATAKVLASLHSANVDAIGLGNYGRRDNYCKRQIERWFKQYLASTSEGKPESNPKMFELADWLRKNIPPEDASGATGGLVHGDFRIDNVVFHPTEDRVIGILDWELSTIGNQMCDVAYSCMPYIAQVGLDTPELAKGFEIVGIPEGIPTQAEFLEEYCNESGRAWPASQWKFYVAFSMFRGASIYTGVYNRWLMGNASGGKRAEHTGRHANSLIDSALAFIAKKTVLPEQPPSVSQGRRQHRTENKVQGVPEGSGRFVPSKKVQELRNKLIQFMEDHIYPVEEKFSKLARSDLRWTVHPEEERLKELAKKEGLWNLWIPFDSAARAKELIYCGSGNTQYAHDRFLGAGLSNLEYGYLCEIMGRSLWAPQIFNCGAPDTGNMEVLLRYGTKEQLNEWLVPLLEGTIRSAFAMTEPQVASSDATNIECSIKREGDSYVINGTKWWTSGAMDPRCRILILMGKTDFTAPKHKQQSMILVDIKTPGISNVRVPAKNILLGEGRGFEIAQGRLGPGRLHHCMRMVGAAERGMQLMAQRALHRKTFGKYIAQHGSFLSDIAKCRIELEQARLLVLEAADQLDRLGNKAARGTIAMAKVAAPSMALKVLDMAIQVHGGAGVSSDTVLAHMWAAARTLRIADGPDEVHLGTIAQLELRRAKL
ncbi:putative acyl-CoA dehydrogenase IBR3 [Hibiscus syriacus]|uniref:Acyl-CoA dehydrogenase IBR3 n=1 Tax=Hibiscus syriacus TaxID=106335 RepID=A0A6A3CN88_HIBSY|nr:putative acyl-CoA dehydrogenase IBR3 [Hibiscus syriacus]